MEERNFYTDLILRTEQSSDCLEDLDPGTKERLIESQIYDKLVRNLIEEEKIATQSEKEMKELDLKAKEAEWRNEKEVKELQIKELEVRLNNEREAAELRIREDEAKWNKIWGGAKIILTGIQVGVSGWFGWNYLKANMQFGNMIGKDGKGWFDEIKRIKL